MLQLSTPKRAPKQIHVLFLAYSEDQDEIPQNAAFYLSLHK